MELTGETLDKLDAEAGIRGVDVETLLAQLAEEVQLPTTPDHEHSAQMLFSCPGGFDPETGLQTEECSYRSFTTADVCPTHGIHVV